MAVDVEPLFEPLQIRGLMTADSFTGEEAERMNLISPI